MKKPGAEHTAVRARGSVVDAWEHSLPDPTAPCFLIEDIYPCVDGGRYPVKRIAGESVEVWADIFREGHDVFAAARERSVLLITHRDEGLDLVDRVVTL